MVRFDYSAFVETRNVCGYFPNRDKYIKKGRGNEFTNAVKECDEFVSDPTVKRDFYFRQLIIKSCIELFRFNLEISGACKCSATDQCKYQT